MKIRDVMTPEPLTLPASASVQEASQLMRDHDVGSVLVCDDAGDVIGMLTDRDVAIRACAEGRAPERTSVASISSDESIAMVSPDDDLQHAVLIMREKAVRRVPVIEHGRPVGIVSIGDIAATEAPHSALGEISRARPNA